MASLEERLADVRRAAGETAPPIPEPMTTFPENTREVSGAGAVAEGFQTELEAAFQGTSPIVRNLQGEPNYERIGKWLEADFGPIALRDDGSWIDFDPQIHVQLIDPATGQRTVYLRSEETDERLLALGRVLSFGAMGGSVPGGVPRFGNLVSRNVIQPAAQATRLGQTVGRFRQAGVTPTLATAMENRTVRGVVSTLRETPVAGNVIERGMARTAGSAADAAEELAASTGGTSVSRLAGGEAAQAGAEAFRGSVNVAGDLSEEAISNIFRTATRNLSLPEGEGFALKARALYQRVDDLFSPTAQVQMTETINALSGSAAKFDLAELGDAFVSPRFERWANAIRNNDGALTYSDLRSFRTEIGRLLAKPQVVLGADLDTQALRELYGAITDDMKTFAETLGPDALQAINRADEFYRLGAEKIQNALNRLLDPNASGEATYDLLVKRAGERAGASLRELQEIRSAMDDATWNEVAASVIREMGRPLAGNAGEIAEVDFSMNRFLTNYNRLSDGGKDILFEATPGLREELDNFAEVLSSIRRTERMYNNSGTGRVLIGSAIGAGAVVDFFSTGVLPVATGAAVGGTVAASTLAAKILMSPRLVRWMADAPTVSFGTVSWANHAAQLNVIASQNQNLAPVIEQMKEILQNEMGVNVDRNSSAQLLQQRLDAALQAAQGEDE